MKKINTLIGLLCGVAILNLNAQTSVTNVNGDGSKTVIISIPAPPTNPPPQNVESFLTTAQNWLTQINTNLHTFDHNRGAVWTGAAYINNDNVASALALEYNFKTNSAWYAQSVTLNTGIAGTILGQELNFGYHIVRKYDVDLSLGAGGGVMRDLQHINIDRLNPNGEVYVQILKAMGVNSYGGLRVEEGFQGSKVGAPLVYVIVGASF
jgi:hypothetical protein